MEKCLNFIKSKKGITICSIVLVVIIALIIILFNNKKTTELENTKVNEFSDKVANYLDEVLLNEKDEGKYINYALEYLYNTTDDKEFSIDKIVNTINDTFDLKYSEEKIEKIGITETMLNKGIVYDSGKKSFKYNNVKTPTDLASIPIIKYNLKKITKKSNEKFILEYEKYLVENPYDILNYYSESDNTHVKEITEYLQGKSKIIVVKNLINKDNIKKIGKIDGTKKITLVIKNNKLLIKQD